MCLPTGTTGTAGGQGKPSYQKHKLFLYKEDFEKFSDALHESLAKIDELKKNAAPSGGQGRVRTER